MSESTTPAPTVAEAEAELRQAEQALVQATAAKPAANSATIETWFNDHFNSLPVGWDTPMRNHVRQAVDDLKTRLA